MAASPNTLIRCTRMPEIMNETRKEKSKFTPSVDKTLLKMFSKCETIEFAAKIGWNIISAWAFLFWRKMFGTRSGKAIGCTLIVHDLIARHVFGHMCLREIISICISVADPAEYIPNSGSAYVIHEFRIISVDQLTLLLWSCNLVLSVPHVEHYRFGYRLFVPFEWYVRHLKHTKKLINDISFLLISIARVPYFASAGQQSRAYAFDGIHVAYFTFAAIRIDHLFSALFGCRAQATSAPTCNKWHHYHLQWMYVWYVYHYQVSNVRCHRCNRNKCQVIIIHGIKLQRFRCHSAKVRPATERFLADIFCTCFSFHFGFRKHFR